MGEVANGLLARLAQQAWAGSQALRKSSRSAALDMQVRGLLNQLYDQSEKYPSLQKVVSSALRVKPLFPPPFLGAILPPHKLFEPKDDNDGDKPCDS